MPSVITVRIPDDLAQRLEPLKSNINISEICRSALESKAQTHERIQEALSEEDVMKGLVKRLRIQRAEANDLSYHNGQVDGQHWAIREATYQKLQRWGQNTTLYRDASEPWEFDMPDSYDWNGDPLVVDMFPTGTAEKLLDACRRNMEKDSQVFELRAYQIGFVEAVREVWSQVKEELEPELNAPWVPAKDNPLKCQAGEKEV